MDETTTTSVGMEDPVSVEAEYDDWDDIDLSDVTDNNPDFPGEEAKPDEDGDADQQDPDDVSENTAEEEEPESGEDEADQSFTLKHLDTTRTVGRDEVITLAQKGLDYDRIRQDRDQARAEAQRLSELEEFLKELAAPSNMTVQDLMDTTRATMLAEREGIDQGVALQRVKLERDRKALELERQNLTRQTEAGQQQAAEQARMKDSMDRFIKDHPDLMAEDIPQDVWEAFASGKDLTDAYAAYEARTLREQLEAKDREIETLKQNKTNQARSTGSQATAGSKSDSEQDEFDRMWYDGT